jgi:DNA-directed RNA polymerase III subunit RPC4
MIRHIRQERPDVALPITISRNEYKEQEVVVATTAELEAQDSLWVDGSSPGLSPVQVEDDNGVWPAAPKNLIRVKNEPGDDNEPISIVMNFDKRLRHPVEQTPSSNTNSEGPASRRTARDQEKLMTANDVKSLARELDRSHIDGEEGQVLLFQFPPILPPLVATNSRGDPSVKDEDEDIVMSDQPAGTSNQVDLTRDDSTLSMTKQSTTLSSQWLKHGGLVGKLNIRRSGKVELDWGGRTLELSRATSRQFLATAMIVEEPDEKPKVSAVAGKGLPMGKIWGRYIVAPNWGEEEEWTVSPNEMDLR